MMMKKTRAKKQSMQCEVEGCTNRRQLNLKWCFEHWPQEQFPFAAPSLRFPERPGLLVKMPMAGPAMPAAA